MSDTLGKGEVIQWRVETLVDKWDSDQTDWVQKKLDEERSLLRQLLRQHPRPIAADFARFKIKPGEQLFTPAPANRAVTVGLDALTKQLIGTSARPWDNTHTGIGMGDGSTGDAIGDTDLSGTNKFYQQMDSTFPSQANGVITFKSTFSSGQAEYAWNEFVIIANTGTVLTMASGATKPTGYTALNRKAPAALGTKGPGASWAFTVSLTFV